MKTTYINWWRLERALQGGAEAKRCFPHLVLLYFISLFGPVSGGGATGLERRRLYQLISQLVESARAAAPTRAKPSLAALAAAAAARPANEEEAEDKEATMSVDDKIDELRRLAPRLSTSELRSALTTANNSLKFAARMLAKIDHGPAKGASLHMV